MGNLSPAPNIFIERPGNPCNILEWLQKNHTTSGSYLGQITSEKRVGTQNRKHPNRGMKKTFKITK